MPETKEEVLSILHEFDGKVRELANMLEEIAYGSKDVLQDQVLETLTRAYYMKLKGLEHTYDLIDDRQSTMAWFREL